MNWDAIGAPAELVGVADVVAPTFCLAIQIHRNPRSVRAPSCHQVVTHLAQADR